MIVVDTNIIVYLLTETPQREAAVLLRKTDENWQVPALWRHEMLNVIATLVRQGYVKKTDSIKLLNNALHLVGENEHNLHLPTALSIAIENKVSAYDAQYITLANELNTLLVTEDKKLLKSFPITAKSMREFCKSQ